MCCSPGGDASTNTHNPSLVPALILLGSMVVPVAFVTFTAGQRVPCSVGAGTVTIVAMVGGVAGVVLAGLLEYDALKDLGALPMIGVAAAAGFAVLETMGHALVVLVRSGGNIPALAAALHATWDSADATWVYVVLGVISPGVVLTATVVLHGRRFRQPSRHAPVPRSWREPGYGV